MPGTRCRMIAGWTLAAMLAGTELGEAAAAPVVLPVPLDMAIDSMTAAFIIAMSLWTIAARLTSLLGAHEERLNAQDEAWTAWRDARTGRPAQLRAVSGDGGA